MYPMARQTVKHEPLGHVHRAFAEIACFLFA